MKRGIAFEQILRAVIVLIVIVVIIAIFYTLITGTTEKIKQEEELGELQRELKQGGSIRPYEACGFGKAGICTMLQDCEKNSIIRTFGLLESQKCQDGYVCCKQE